MDAATLESKIISNVTVLLIKSDGKFEQIFNQCNVTLYGDAEGLIIKIKNTDKLEKTIKYSPSTDNDEENNEITFIGDYGQLIKTEQCVIFVTITNDVDVKKFRRAVNVINERRKNSVFNARTDESSASQYFQFYGYLCQQQNMMQDYVRTSTYQKAILSNLPDFADKVVLDVGAGSGILSFFAAQAGASKIYAVEASNMAQYAQQLVTANELNDRIRVIAGKIEEIELPEKVDMIISEPMGYMLYNERMLETYLHAKKWLKPDGKMFPSRGDLHIAPFTDDALFMEQFNKTHFWYQTSFHGVDLSSLRTPSIREYFRQPIVDTFDIRICMAKSVRHSVNFLEADESDLHNINIPLEFHMLESGTCHGLAFWFDVEFAGSVNPVWLSTSPTEPLTHWYQIRCLLQYPICVKQGQLLTGHVVLVANKRQSYDITMELQLEGSDIKSTNMLDLKNPYFRYTGVPASAPPGGNTTSPSENYWSHLDAQGAKSAITLVNGISVNGMGEMAMDSTQFNSNCFSTGNPSIHPGCISSTGRNRINSSSSIGGGGGGGVGVQSKAQIISDNVILQAPPAIVASTLHHGNIDDGHQQINTITTSFVPNQYPQQQNLNDHSLSQQPPHQQVSLLNDLLSTTASHNQNRSCSSTTNNFIISSENATVVDAPMLSAMEQMFSVIQQP